VSKAEKRRLELEACLIEVFNRQIQAAHANPKRVGCPGTSALRKLAFSPHNYREDYVLIHIGYCAPCLEELCELHRQCISLRSAG
jgi:hypothetical protein